jgi:hypothetical protein
LVCLPLIYPWFSYCFGSSATAGFLSILVDPDMDINYDVICGIYLVATVICSALYVGEKFLDVEAIEGFWLVVSRVKFACHSGVNCVHLIASVLFLDSFCLSFRL